MCVATIAGGCNRNPPSAFVEHDGGAPAPVDPLVVADRLERYTSVADRVGTERCRCAGDYDYCRLELQADWDVAGRACLADVIRLDGPGATLAVECLETAVSTFETCHSALACPAATNREECFGSWTSAGSACLTQMNESARVKLATCVPTSPDAGP